MGNSVQPSQELVAMRIAPDDTLSEIALRLKTTVEQLAKINDISNPDLIYAGDTLRTDAGAGDPAAGSDTEATSGPAEVGSTDRPNVSGNNAAEIAEQFIGRNASELKKSGDLPMESWVPDNVNCANFVSGALQKAGVIDPSQASVSVDGLANNLKGAGWQTVSLQDAQPGDVVLMQKNGQSHVVLFAGFENGEPKFIGSNNINPDGSQQVSWGGASGDYEIVTPPR